MAAAERDAALHQSGPRPSQNLRLLTRRALTRHHKHLKRTFTSKTDVKSSATDRRSFANATSVQVALAGLTGLTDDGPWPQLQHHGDHGDVRGVEDLRAVRQGDRPQLWRRVKHVHPSSLAAGDLGPVRFSDQVGGVADGAIARLCLGAMLHLHRHHGVMAQVDDGGVAILNVVRVFHKTHVELCNSNKAH